MLTIVRRTMGSDIAGACGQLVRQQERHYAAQRAAAAPATAAATHAATADIEDLPWDQLGASAPVERSRATQPPHPGAAPPRLSMLLVPPPRSLDPRRRRP